MSIVSPHRQRRFHASVVGGEVSRLGGRLQRQRRERIVVSDIYTIISTGVVVIKGETVMSSDCAKHNLTLASEPAVPALPLSTRILLYLTTAPFRPQRWMAPESVARLAALAHADWTLRMAPARNFLLWRYGKTLSSTRARLLVLPLDFGRVDLQGRIIFIAAEIVRAEDRVAGLAFGNDPDTDRRIRALCATTATNLGVTLDTAEPLYRKALRDIEARA